MQTQREEIYRVFTESVNDYVTMEWHGYANSTQFREGTERMLEELKHRGMGKVLGNIRNMVLISQDDQNWLHEQFLPRAIAAGFRAIALVRPLHYFNKVAVESVAYKVDQDLLKVQFFNNLQEARQWLNSVE